jgi:hypothetical protein
LDISWIVEQLLTSQEGFFSMELLDSLVGYKHRNKGKDYMRNSKLHAAHHLLTDPKDVEVQTMDRSIV